MYTLIPPLGMNPPDRKVIFVGLRGVPEIQGGVETHVAAISARLAAVVPAARLRELT